MREFIVGNRQSGYAIRRRRKGEGRAREYPWEGQVWNDGRIVWADTYRDREKAESYLRRRARAYGVRTIRLRGR